MTWAARRAVGLFIIAREISALPEGDRDAALAAMVAAAAWTSFENLRFQQQLAPDEARAVDAAPGAPALSVLRRYFSEETGLFQVAESVHPADRFGPLRAGPTHGIATNPP